MAKEQELDFETIAAQVLAEAKKAPDLGTVAKALLCCGLSVNRVAEKLGSIAFHLKYLGNGDAGSTMGAIEFLSVSVKESAQSIASALSEVGTAIDNHE
jgi:hypothetical protein